MKYAVIFLFLFFAGVGYLVWLDAGCELGGAMTWEGKKCFDELTD